MHEGHARRYQDVGSVQRAGAALRTETVLDTIVSVAVEALALDVFLRPVNCEVYRDDGHQRFALVFGNGLPGDEIDLLEGVGQSVVIAEEVEVVILVVESAHLLAGFDLFLFQFGRVQFIAEGAAHGYGSFGLERNHWAGFRDVCSHGAHGIEEGGAVVELEVIQRFGVVGAPVLDKIREHGRFKAPAAAGAALKHDIRVGLHDAVENAVEAEYIAV